MQVNTVNTPVASATGPNQAEDTGRRAEDFSRVLQNAFFGQGSKAVAKSGEQSTQDYAPRTETRETRPAERPAAERPAERPVERPADRSETRDDSRDQTARTEATQSKPADKPAEKPTEKPKADKVEDKPATQEAAAETDAAPKADDSPKVEAKPETTDGEAADAETLEDAAQKPVVAAAPDANLILSLLQQLQAPVVTPVTGAAAAGEAVLPTVAVTMPVTTPVAPAAPGVADAALGALQAADTAVTETVAPVVTPVLPDAATAKAATEASVAALLSQQQTLSAEDFAAIQKALQQQAEGQLQADVQTVEAEPELQMQIAQAAGNAVVVPKADGKPEKSLILDVQTVSTAAPKTLVDQSALMAMQGDAGEDADAALLMQQQMQAQQTAGQAMPEAGKFAAALHMQQASAEPLLAGNAPTAQSPAHLSTQGTAATGATTATAGSQAAQASQHASNQTLARNLNAYVTAGEQVAVHIKKGAAEGLDKISIRLDPGNLGHVDVKLEVGHDGRLMAVIAAEKPDTLQMLQKDSASLEQSLRDAGLKTDQQSLNFALRDQNSGQDGREGRGGHARGHNGRGHDDYADAGRADPAQLAAANAQRAAQARGGLDIRI